MEGAGAVVCLAWLIQPSRDLETGASDQRRRQPRASSRPPAGSASPRCCTPRRSAPTRPARRTAPSTRAGRRRASRAPSTRATRPRSSGCSTASRPSTPRCASSACGPALVFKREAASEIRRLFAGPFLPSPLRAPPADPGRPEVDRACASRPCTRSTSARRSGSPLHAPVRGAFNLAADPVLDGDELGRAARRAAAAACTPACCAPPRTSPGACGSSRLRRAGSTWRSACRS